MKHLEFNSGNVLLKAKENTSLRNALTEAVFFLKTENLDSIDLDFNDYLLFIDKDTDNKEIERMLKDYEFAKKYNYEKT